MFKHNSLHFPHYFHKHLNRRLEELYLSVGLQDLAVAMVALFEPIYFYNLGFGVDRILWFYVVVYGLYLFLLPLGGKIVARFGPQRSIMISTLMLIGYYSALLFLPSNPVFFWVAPALLALQKTLYWPGYHADFIKVSDRGERGKEYSGLWSLSTMMYIVGPVIGGMIIKLLGFHALFPLVIGLILLSSLPLWWQKLHWKSQAYSYWHSFLTPLRPQHRRSLIGYLALGEELILLTIWPIFIALAFKDFLSIGGAVAIATFITALVTLYIGKLVDEGLRIYALRVGGIATAFVWLTRPWLASLTGVFLSDTIGRIAKNTTFVSVTSLAYERSVREHSPIERAVFYEQGYAIAKLLMALIVLVLMQFVPPFTAAFLAAGTASLLYLVFR